METKLDANVSGERNCCVAPENVTFTSIQQSEAGLTGGFNSGKLVRIANNCGSGRTTEVDVKAFPCAAGVSIRKAGDTGADHATECPAVLYVF